MSEPYGGNPDLWNMRAVAAKRQEAANADLEQQIRDAERAASPIVIPEPRRKHTPEPTAEPAAEAIQAEEAPSPEEQE
jgi:hypothetical protein